MKKLVLFFAVAAAMSFAACSNANKTQEAQPEASQEQVEAPVAPVVEEAPADSSAVEAAPAEAAAEVAPAEAK